MHKAPDQDTLHWMLDEIAREAWRFQVNTGGPAFPVQDTVYPNGQVQTGTYGMTLLDWYAGQETLAEFDHPEATYGDSLASAFAGPKPPGGWAQDPRGMFEWEAKVRAGMKYTRASAMLAEKARREAVVKESSTTDHSKDSLGKVAKLEAANKELVEAFGRFFDYVSRVNGVAVFQEPMFAEMRAILTKHKGAA